MSDSNAIMGDLERLAVQINESKRQKAELEGRLDEQKDQLSKLGFSTVEAAEAELLELRTKIDNMKSELEKGYEELKRDFEW